MASSLGFIKVEEQVKDHFETDLVTFQQYATFVQKKLNERLSGMASIEVEPSRFFAKLDEVCWLLCCKKYLQREPPHNTVLSRDHVYLLWRIFNFYAEKEEKDEENKDDTDEARAESFAQFLCPVVVEREEIELVLQRFSRIAGLKFRGSEFAVSIADDVKQFQFPQFLSVLESRYCTGLSEQNISEVVHELHDQVINEAIRKVSHMQLLPFASS